MAEATTALPELPSGGGRADERLGSVISDRYRLDQLLGEGAMGRVYAAEHVMMRKRVAVKILHRELTRVPEVVTRFEREAMAAANIDHPNVATATDFGKLDDGSIFLVLEFVSGEQLRQALYQPLPLPRVLHITRQICSAVASAHQLDIVHRDLKPENVMLVEKAGDPDFVKVLDFGIAKVPIQEAGGGTQGVEAITKAGMVFGTPEYMAPEQALGKQVDARADIYALGVMMFEMLAGKRPFDDDAELGVLGQQLSLPVPTFVERAPAVATVPPQVESCVRRLLSRDTKDRQGSMIEVVRELDVLRATFGGGPGVNPGSIPGSIPDFASYPDFGSIPDLGGYPQTPSSGPVGAASSGSFNAASPNQPQIHTAALPAESDVPLSVPRGSSASIPGPISVQVPSGPTPPVHTDLAELRGRLPALLRDLPAGVLFGVPIGVFLVGIILVAVVVSAMSSDGEGPAGGKTAGATAEPGSGAPGTGPTAAELNEAKGQGVEALTALAAKYPKDTKSRLHLARAHTVRKNHVEAVAAVKSLLQLDPTKAPDPQVASTLWVAAQDETSEETAFELLQGLMAQKGADIVYDLATTKGVRASVKKRAEAWLKTKDFDRQSTPALNVAVLLRFATRCSQRHALAKRARNTGDARALEQLRKLERRTGCGRRSRSDCNPCLRKDKTLQLAIAAIEQRVK